MASVSGSGQGPTTAARDANRSAILDRLENTRLSPRLIAVLRQSNCVTLSCVTALSDEAILLPGIGRYYLTEIRRQR